MDITLEELEEFLKSDEGKLFFRKSTPEFDGQGSAGTSKRKQLKERFTTKKNFEFFQMFKKIEREIEKQKKLEKLLDENQIRKLDLISR